MNQTVYVCLSGASRAITQQLLQLLLAAFVFSVQSQNVRTLYNKCTIREYSLNKELEPPSQTH